MTLHSAIVGHHAGLAFDSIAEQYDDIFTRSLVGRAQRDAVWEVLRQTFQRGDRILELNCGTGEDALFLAGLGLSVLACDASEKMISFACRRQAREAPQSAVQFQVLSTEQLAELTTFAPFDGAFSNFSGLNCVADLGSTARQLSLLVKPGGRALLCLSSRVCLWETMWYLAQRDPKRAFQRWKGQTIAALGDVPVEVRYPTVRDLRNLFSPFFALRGWKGIGVAVPPSYLEHVAKDHEVGLHRLQRLDRVLLSLERTQA
ncbi:MAG: methyltransferase domain-containing protein [Candidatus Korobacteraceae bacterium]